jgi:hypothetical protein
LLPGIEGFAFGHIALDVDQDYFVADVFMCQYIGAGCADVTRADDGYFTHLLRQFDLVKEVGNQEFSANRFDKQKRLAAPRFTPGKIRQLIFDGKL